MTKQLSLTILAVLALGAAGCGKSPEDKAHDAGKEVGSSIAKMRTATSAEDKGKEIDDIRAEVSKAAKELPQGYAADLKNIGGDLQTDIQKANGDPTAIREALATAKQSFTELNSNTDSVINEFARGVREGYSDQLN